MGVGNQKTVKTARREFYDGAFKSEGAARLAGEKALVELLDRMARGGD